ncbi:MAG TPA: hypothetical protein VJ739_19370 [Gemmataceae bacterium]|nr:hypothetical protein [Gemmataceae bacterium]
MTFDPSQAQQLSEPTKQAVQQWYKRQADLHNRIRYLVEVLLGDIYGTQEDFLATLAQKVGRTPEELASMAKDRPAEFLDVVCEVKDLPSPTDSLIAALDLLFQARFGWKPGDVARRALPEILLGLEHAIEYTPPGKPSIFQLTE